MNKNVCSSIHGTAYVVMVKQWSKPRCGENLSSKIQLLHQATRYSAAIDTQRRTEQSCMNSTQATGMHGNLGMHNVLTNDERFVKMQQSYNLFEKPFFLQYCCIYQMQIIANITVSLLHILMRYWNARSFTP